MERLQNLYYRARYSATIEEMWQEFIRTDIALVQCPKCKIEKSQWSCAKQRFLDAVTLVAIKRYLADKKMTPREQALRAYPT